MNNEEYLSQISTSIRPAKKPAGKGILPPNIIKLIIGAVAAIIVIAVAGSLLGGGGNTNRDRAYELKYRLDNTISVISVYQPQVKSSALRSSSASLQGVFTNTSQELGKYIEDNYKIKEKEVNKKLIEQATLEKDGLEADLFEAKINGILDRIYAHKMAYEISIVLSMENKLIGSTKNDDLKLLLDKSVTSLDNLYNNFNNFSEGK